MYSPLYSMYSLCILCILYVFFVFSMYSLCILEFPCIPMYSQVFPCILMYSFAHVFFRTQFWGVMSPSLSGPGKNTSETNADRSDGVRTSLDRSDLKRTENSGPERSGHSNRALFLARLLVLISFVGVILQN